MTGGPRDGCEFLPAGDVWPGKRVWLNERPNPIAGGRYEIGPGCLSVVWVPSASPMTVLRVPCEKA